MWNWPNVLIGFGTLSMAVVIIITSIFAYRTWKNTLKRDKFNLGSQLFYEFTELYLDLFEKLSKEELRNISSKDYEILNKGSYRIILFLSKLGNFLRRGKINIEEIELFFYSHLVYRDSVLILIINLRNFTPKLLSAVKSNFNYLLNEIGRHYSIREYENVINKLFRTMHKVDLTGQVRIIGRIVKNKKKND